MYHKTAWYTKLYFAWKANPDWEKITTQSFRWFAEQASLHNAKYIQNNRFLITCKLKLILSWWPFFGLFLVNDLQTPPILKKSRLDILVQIVEKRPETNEKRIIKKNIDPVLDKDMQTPLPQKEPDWFLIQIVEKRPETNEKRKN